MLPTMERRRARSTYSSVRRFWSWTASRVSDTPTLTMMRLLTAAPAPGSPHSRVHESWLLELPHPDGEEESDAHERYQHGRAAIAHERQRDPHDGKQARDHPMLTRVWVANRA